MHKIESFKVGFGYVMPHGEMLEIRCNKDIRELEIALDEEVEGVSYSIFWGKEPLICSFNTEMKAITMALGCQFGAFEMLKRIKK